MRRVLLTLTLAWVGLTVIPKASAQTVDLEDTHAALQQARELGWIDDGTYGLYLRYLVYAPERLPELYRPVDLDNRGHLRCATPALTESRQLEAVMTDEQLADAYAVGGRPVPCGGCTICGTNVCVHYNNAGDSGYAQTTFDLAEESWGVEMGSQGWLAPPADFGAQSGDELDIYLAPTGFGGAYTQPESTIPSTNWDDMSSFIVIDDSIPTNLMGVFVAHEMNHSVQFSYDWTENALLFESTATFIEDKVYDSTNDYTWYVTDFQGLPQRSLDYVTYNDVYMYGAAIFMHFLSEAYDNGGTDLVKDLWDRSRQSTGSNEPDFYDALNDIMTERGATLRDALTEFGFWRPFTGTYANTTDYFSEGNLWASVSMIGSHSLTTQAGFGTSTAPMEYGANYAVVNTSAGASGDRFAVSLWGDTSKDWTLLLIGVGTDGSTCVAAAPTNTDGWSSAYVDDLSDYSTILLGFLNMGPPGAIRDPDNSFYGTSSFSYDLEYSSNAADIGSGGRVVCGTPTNSGGDDDEPIGCLCAVQQQKPPRGFGANGAVWIAILAGGLAISWRRRSSREACR